MATGQRVDPYRNFNYVLEIDGITQAGFSECSGLGATADPIEYREGNESHKQANPKTPRKLHGMTKFDNISLKWGLTDNKDLYDWFKRVTDGSDEERKTGAVIVLDLEGNETSRWNFTDAWPTKWTGPTFNATANEVAIETLELAHEGITRAA